MSAWLRKAKACPLCKAPTRERDLHLLFYQGTINDAGSSNDCAGAEASPNEGKIGGGSQDRRQLEQEAEQARKLYKENRVLKGQLESTTSQYQKLVQRHEASEAKSLIEEKARREVSQQLTITRDDLLRTTKRLRRAERDVKAAKDKLLQHTKVGLAEKYAADGRIDELRHSLQEFKSEKSLKEECRLLNQTIQIQHKALQVARGNYQALAADKRRQAEELNERDADIKHLQAILAAPPQRKREAFPVYASSDDEDGGTIQQVLDEMTMLQSRRADPPAKAGHGSSPIQLAGTKRELPRKHARQKKHRVGKARALTLREANAKHWGASFRASKSKRGESLTWRIPPAGDNGSFVKQGYDGVGGSVKVIRSRRGEKLTSRSRKKIVKSGVHSLRSWVIPKMQA